MLPTLLFSPSVPLDHSDSHRLDAHAAESFWPTRAEHRPVPLVPHGVKLHEQHEQQQSAAQQQASQQAVAYDPLKYTGNICKSWCTDDVGIYVASASARDFPSDNLAPWSESWVHTTWHLGGAEPHRPHQPEPKAPTSPLACPGGHQPRLS